MVILVLNLGLKSVRCIAFSFDGNVITQSSKAIHTFVNNEMVEQDPEEWRNFSWQVMGNVISGLGKRSENIRYITVTTSVSCLMVLDKEGRLLRNSILVSDSRTQKEAQLLAQTVEFSICTV